MQITCQECQGKFRIADEKIPENKSVNISCPKCRKKIRVKGKQSEQTMDAPAKPGGEALPFEVFGGQKTAMVCCGEDETVQSLQKRLTEMGFKTVIPKNSEDAIKMSRFHPFDIAVIDDTFDSGTTSIYGHLQTLPMLSRRKLFVAYISDQFRTNDYMGAYCQSVNLVVSRKQIPKLNTILTQAMKENDIFYSVYDETIQKYA